MKMSKGWIYSVITMAVSAAYMAIVFAADFAMKSLGGYTAGWLKLSALFVLVLMFQPIMSGLQAMIDKKFFKTNIEAERIREKFSAGIKKLTRIDKLAEYINRVAFRTFKLSGSAVFVFDEDTEKYRCYDARGILSGMKNTLLGKQDDLVAECSKGKIIKRKNKELCVPSFSKKKKKLVGFLLAGEKSSQDAFNGEEILLLETMANQAVMSVENAILYRGRIEAAKKKLLMKRLSDLGQAASNVAKQARMTLTPIMDFAAQFREKWNNGDFIESAAGTLPFETERLRLILTSVLIYSRESKPASDEIKLNDIFSWLSKLVKAKEKEKNISIEYKVSDDLVVKIGKDNIKQVLLNLVLNAFDAMPNGGKIAVSAEIWEGKIYVKVQDTGQGIPEKDLDKIFNPFFTTKQNAIGLGLTVVKRIVEENNGDLKVNSEPGKGTTFTLAFQE